MKLEDYAMKILTDHGCDIYTYGGEWSKNILNDLKEEYPDGMDYGFGYVEVANAILAVSRPEPIKERKPWISIYDGYDFCDGVEFDTYEDALSGCESILLEWINQTRGEWRDYYNPTEDELEDYNMMIDNFSVWIEKYNPQTDEYEDCYCVPEEYYDQIGWKELTMEDIKEERIATGCYPEEKED